MKEDTWKLIWKRDEADQILEFTDLDAAVYFRDNICTKYEDTHSIRIKNGNWYDSTLIVSEFISDLK